MQGSKDARIQGCKDPRMQGSKDARILAVESPRLQKISYRLPDCSNDKMIQKIFLLLSNLMGLLQCEEPVHGPGKNTTVTVLEARTNTSISKGFESPANPSV